MFLHVSHKIHMCSPMKSTFPMEIVQNSTHLGAPWYKTSRHNLGISAYGVKRGRGLKPGGHQTCGQFLSGKIICKWRSMIFQKKMWMSDFPLPGLIFFIVDVSVTIAGTLNSYVKRARHI
jgi:hypothetical protein